MDWTSSEGARTFAAAAADSFTDDSALLTDPDDVMASTAALSGKTLRQLAAESSPITYHNESAQPLVMSQTQHDRESGVIASNVQEIAGINHR